MEKEEEAEEEEEEEKEEEEQKEQQQQHPIDDGVHRAAAATEKIAEIDVEVRVECSLNSVAFLAHFCLVQTSNRAVNAVPTPPSPPHFGKHSRWALICFAIFFGGA